MIMGVLGMWTGSRRGNAALKVGNARLSLQRVSIPKLVAGTLWTHRGRSTRLCYRRSIRACESGGRWPLGFASLRKLRGVAARPQRSRRNGRRRAAGTPWCRLHQPTPLAARNLLAWSALIWGGRERTGADRVWPRPSFFTRAICTGPTLASVSFGSWHRLQVTPKLLDHHDVD
jgi:hypothetical protein